MGREKLAGKILEKEVRLERGLEVSQKKAVVMKLDLLTEELMN